MFLDVLKRKLFSNFSFILLVFGAGSNFLLTILVKKVFLQSEFNTYSLFLTFIGIVSSFGLIGLDQVFLRLSHISKNNNVVINRDVFVSIFIAVFVVPVIISSYFFNKDSSIHFYQYVLTAISINLIILSYNTFRLVSAFNTAQFFKNGYRVFSLIALTCVVGLFNIQVGINGLINIILCFAIFFAVIGGFSFFNKIEIDTGKTPRFLNFFISFSINLALITVLSFGERIIILDHIGENEFGKYFYYSTIFLFPLTLVQQYVGFKELIGFKKNVDVKIIHSKIKTIIIVGFLIVGLIVLTAIVDDGYFLDIDFKNDYLLIILLSVLGVIKLIYGVFSAVLGAVGQTKDIYYINAVTVFFVLLSLIYLYIQGISLISVVLCLIMIFLLRSFYIYYNYAVSPKKKTSNKY